MPCLAQTASILSLAAFLSVGCAEHFNLIGRDAVGGGPLLAFWPPPSATSIYRDSEFVDSDISLAAHAERVAEALRSAGYSDAKWYAIGAHYTHGFAVTTRLEKVHDDGTPMLGQQRWSPKFPEAANLFWLEGARQMRLPARGSYRVFLVAFTDLPIGPTNEAPLWNEQTWMSERPRTELPSARRASSTYHLGAFVYEYDSDAWDGEGGFVPTDAKLSAAAHLRRSGIDFEATSP